MEIEAQLYYKVPAGTDTHEKITDLLTHIALSKNTIREFAAGLGATKILTCGLDVVGKPTGFMMDTKPEGWVFASKDDRSFFFPKRIKSNVDLLAQIDALPKVTFSDIGAAVGFDCCMHHPGICRHPKGYYLVNVELFPDDAYAPPADMIEINGAEYLQLKSETKGGTGK